MTSKKFKHEDAYGVNIRVGDRVIVISGYGHYNYKGRVIKLTEKRVLVECINHYYNNPYKFTWYKVPTALVVLERLTTEF